MAGILPVSSTATRKGDAMKLSRIEQETIINFNEAEIMASIYTHNAALKERLSGLCRDHPSQVRKTADNGRGGLTFELPKKWLKVTPPRVLSPAQREVVDRMNANRRKGS